MPHPFQSILGIKFYIGELPGLLELCQAGNFVVVPAAPALVDLTTDAHYRAALENSDLAITDSGFMVILWKFLTGQSLTRISGLKLIRGLLDSDELKQPGSSFWIMPSAKESDVNLAWLQNHGYAVTADQCYVAPFYTKGAIADPALLALIETHRPRYILVNIGGGTQEPLGLYLRQNLSYRPLHHLHRCGHRLSHRDAGAHPGLGRYAHAWLAFAVPPRAVEIHAAHLEGPAPAHHPG